MFPKFTIPRMLTKPEERRLLATVRAQGSRRDVALLTLALGTGLRLREIRGLNVGDIRVEGEATAWKWPCPDSVDGLPTLPEQPTPFRILPG